MYFFVWIGSETCTKIEERRQRKAKMLATTSPTLLERANKLYRGNDREVKRCAREDKRAFVEGLVREAEPSCCSCGRQQQTNPEASHVHSSNN